MAHTDTHDISTWRKRRNWAKVAWIYSIMLMVSVFFIMPYIIASLASLKINPLETPFTYVFERVKPNNWIAAARLGGQAGGGILWGGFNPSEEITLNFSIAMPMDEKDAEIKAEVPLLKAGSGTALLGLNAQPKDFLTLSPLSETKEPQKTTITYTQKGEDVHIDGLIRHYAITLSHAHAEWPVLKQVPFNLQFPNRRFQLIDASLPNDRLERRGMIASWENIAPGWLGYMLHNYVRAVDNDRDPNTGKSYLLQWFKNSFFISLGRVLY